MSEVKKRALHFSVQGELVNRLAIEKAYYEKDVAGAIELLMSCLVTDQLSDMERMALAIQVLDGTKRLQGVYPGDYGIFDVPPDERKPDRSFMGLLRKITADLKEKTEKCRTYDQQLACIANYLDNENMLRAINRDWEHNWDGDGVIFEDYLPRVEDNDGPVSIFGSAMLESYMDRMSSGGKTADYGWLAPDGTFHEVEFADHQSWAYKYLKKTDPELAKKTMSRIDRAGDILMEKGWVLLHNPGLGVAFPTKAPEHRYTSKQKDFLYGYYIDRGKTDKANEIMKEDDL